MNKTTSPEKPKTTEDPEACDDGCWESNVQAARWNLFVHKIGKHYTEAQQICLHVCLLCVGL